MRIEIAGGYIVVEPVICEGFEYLSAEDLQSVTTLHSSSRRSEWLSWRNIVRRELRHCRLGYSPEGAPVLVEKVDGIAYLSVSHTRLNVAVMFSDKPCGIDLEAVERNFGRVASRYVNSDEELLQQTLGQEWMAIVWCAKEALFKWGRRTRVDFLNDVKITSVDSANRCLRAEFFGSVTPAVHYCRLGDEILCYISE